MTPLQHPATTLVLPAAWNVLHQAITQRRAVHINYHQKPRIICPHALGWKNGRPKTLAYQTAIHAPTSAPKPIGWRSLFIDEIETATLTDHQWQTAPNYTPHTTGIDTIAIALP